MNEHIKKLIMIFIIVALVLIACAFIISLYWDASAVACGENETVCRVLFVLR